MQPLPQSTAGSEEARAIYERFAELSEQYRNDASLRARIGAGDAADWLRELGIAVAPGMEARVVADTHEVRHLVFPPDPNIALSDEALDMIAGGKTAGTAGSAGTASTVVTSTALGTASSAGSAATVGSAS